MKEWKIELPIELSKELEECFDMGPIIDDNEQRFLTEEVVDRIKGLKIEIFSNEHPPPHFRVCYSGECNNFTIQNCEAQNGNALSSYFRNIKKWHKKNKDILINFWNQKRPTDCVVGEYRE